MSAIGIAVQDGFDKWDKRALALIALLCCWRLFFLAAAPLELAADEAYYWDWSRIPALGYYSKPPLIAWINLVSSTLLPHSAFTVRLPAAVFSIVSLLAIYGLGRRIFSPRTAFWAVAAMAASPAGSAGGFIMTIDAPLVCFWTLGLYCLWRAITDPGEPYRWWFAAAIIAGFGVLSKQMMLVFLVLAPVFLFLHKEYKHLLSTVKPYLLIVLALAALLPPLYWNMQHEWITFQHTTHHFAPRSGGGLHFVKTVGDFVGAQLLLFSPISCFLVWLVSAVLLYRFRSLASPVRFLLLFGGFCLVFFLLLSFRQQMNANWPAVYYPAGMILLAAWGCREISLGPAVDRLRIFFVPGVVVGALGAVMVYGLPFYLAGSPLGGSRYDPFLQLKGWQELARGVESVREDFGSRDKVFLVAAKRQVVSELAFYLPDRPRVYKWTSWPGVIDSQYDMWPKPDSRIGQDGLIILHSGVEVPDELAESFTAIRKIRDLDIPLGPGGSRKFTVYSGTNLQKWPR